MSILKNTTRGLLLAAVSLSVAGLAQAQTYYQNGAPRSTSHRYATRHYRHYSSTRNCSDVRRSHGNNGTAVGAVTGGVLGSALGGGKFTNVLLGAGAGAVAGHAIGKGTVHC